MRHRQIAEIRKLAASTNRPNAAPSTWAMTPPSPGPTVCMADSVPNSRAFASSSCRAGTMPTTSLVCAVRRNTVANPISRATTSKCGRDSTPNSQAIGTLMAAAAATRSAKIITGRAGHWSIHAPAGRPISTQGSQVAAVSTPIQAAPASKVTTASNGSSTELVAVPSTLTPSPNQSREKPRLFRSGTTAGACSRTAVMAGPGTPGRTGRSAPASARRRESLASTRTRSGPAPRGSVPAVRLG